MDLSCAEITKKRIAIVANSTWNIYNFRLNVVKKFVEMGNIVFVIAPVDEYISYKEQFPGVKHIPLRYLDRDAKNPIKDLLLIEEFRRKYKRLKLDLILHYTHKPNIYGTIAARISGIPSVSVVTGLGYTFINKGLVNSVTKMLYRISSSFHKKIIFENQDDLAFFKELNIVRNGEGVAIKGCGVDLQHYQPSSNGIFHDKIVFTFIGRLLKDKGIREFVRAAELIKSKYDNVEFWVIGELDEGNPSTISSETLANWVNEDIIDYHGFVKDIRPLVKKSNCIVLPSYREGMPRIVIEAQAMGKPVITTDVPGCRESIEPNKSGYLVDVKSAEGLSIALDKFIKLSKEQRLKMGLKGRQKAEAEFGQDHIAEQIYTICLSVL